MKELGYVILATIAFIVSVTLLTIVIIIGGINIIIDLLKEIFRKPALFITDKLVKLGEKIFKKEEKNHE